jgi:AcrR family transcriptional regulator
MAKPGQPSRPRSDHSGPETGTRQALVDAAIETLHEEGFAGASARAIARRAGCNQALVFYYFGSVVDLLLAALDAVSQARFVRYSAAVEVVTNPADLLAVAVDVFREDLDAGYATVLVEMIAGASSTPGLGAEVARRIAPWADFAESAVSSALADSPLRAMVPTGEVAHAIVALYLGLEMLANLDGDRGRATALFGHLALLVSAFEALSPRLMQRENR